MVRKKLAVAILALSALQATVAGAMGLGNLSVKSALNQPLSAEIKLLDTGDLDPTQIKIQLAAPEDFERAGVDRDFFLTNLRFDIAMDGHGGGTIKVSTREPVVEPYLNFVIEARWPNGRLLREFAVLLDPPTFSANKAAAPVTPATSAGAQSVKPRAAQPPVVQTEAGAAAAAPAADMSLPAAGAGEYRVQVYDTLSKIAARFKPASDVSVAQTMIAIQRANPQVFIRNNVNLIKSGYVLRLPSADEARAITPDQATQEVDSQIAEWRGSRSSSSAATSAPATGPQLDASAPEPSSKESGYREQARLSIATAGDAEKGGTGSSGKGVDALRQQLGQSQEALEKGKRDNKELQSRLDDMERQIATLQRLISLKDEQLSVLQAKSADAAKPVVPLTPPTETPAVAAPAPAATEPTAAATPAPAPVATPAPAVVAPKPVPKPAIKPAAPAPKPTFLDQVVANPALYLGGGFAAILAALGIPMLIKRQRRKAWHERQAESETLSFADDNLQFDTSAFDENVEEAAAAEETEVFPANVEEPAPAADEAPKKAVRSETGDPIAESDIYIAYGRYQQAVDLLSSAIDAEPNRSDLRTKLLEVYVEMRNKDAFRQQFVALQSLGDSNAVAHVKDLLSSVDGISDWLDDLPGSSSLSSGTAFATAAMATAAVAPALDFDFDDESEDAADVAPETELELSDDLAALESSFADEADITDAENPLDLDLDDELLVDDIDTELPESFMRDSEPVSSFAGAETSRAADSFESTQNFETENFEAESFEGSSFETPGFETTSFEPTPAADNVAITSDDEGLELDLGDDDLDQALNDLDSTENLGDLEDMTGTPVNLDVQATEAPVDLAADLDELPEEFDLSQTSTELPEVERAGVDEFEAMSFEEPFVESGSEPELEPEPEPESAPAIDVFAGMNQPAPAPFEQPPVEAPTLEGGDDFDFLADADEVATKLDLARAYIDMGDTEGARDILDEVIQEGTDTQKQEASNLLSRIG